MILLGYGTCRQTDGTYKGAERKDATTGEACKKACQLDGDCAYANWNPVQIKCWLFVYQGLKYIVATMNPDIFCWVKVCKCYLICLELKESSPSLVSDFCF